MDEDESESASTGEKPDVSISHSPSQHDTGSVSSGYLATPKEHKPGHAAQGSDGEVGAIREAPMDYSGIPTSAIAHNSKGDIESGCGEDGKTNSAEQTAVNPTPNEGGPSGKERKSAANHIPE